MAAASAPPVVTAVALSTAYLKLGELARRAFTGSEVFVLEKGRIPLVAVVSAREWMEYLALRFPERSITVRRTALSAPRTRVSGGKKTGKRAMTGARTQVPRSAAASKRRSGRPRNKARPSPLTRGRSPVRRTPRSVR